MILCATKYSLNLTILFPFRHINKSSQDKNAIASFSLPEEPVILSISQTTSRDQSLLLSAVTKNGMLLVFEHTLNGYVHHILYLCSFMLRCNLTHPFIISMVVGFENNAWEMHRDESYLENTLNGYVHCVHYLHIKLFIVKMFV